MRTNVIVERRKRQRSEEVGIFLVLEIEGAPFCDIGELKDEKALTIWQAWIERQDDIADLAERVAKLEARQIGTVSQGYDPVHDGVNLGALVQD